ncbi:MULTISPECIES: DUF7556 family protein [Halorussus]|nr:hypothetical protein [Halorussus vallis]
MADLVTFRERFDGELQFVVADPERPNAWLCVRDDESTSLDEWR